MRDAEDFGGKMYNVHSGNMKQVGWEFDTQTNQGVMRVVFNNEKTYDYFPVPKTLYNQLWKAKSKGKWFHSEIKNNQGISYEEVY